MGGRLISPPSPALPAMSRAILLSFAPHPLPSPRSEPMAFLNPLHPPSGESLYPRRSSKQPCPAPKPSPSRTVMSLQLRGIRSSSSIALHLSFASPAPYPPHPFTPLSPPPLPHSPPPPP